MVLWLEWRWVEFDGFDLVAFPVLGPVLCLWWFGCWVDGGYYKRLCSV